MHFSVFEVIREWSHGGQSTFAKQVPHGFGDRIAVASTTEENIPLRRWCDRSFNGKDIKYFNMGRMVQKEGRRKPKRSSRQMTES